MNNHPQLPSRSHVTCSLLFCALISLSPLRAQTVVSTPTPTIAAATGTKSAGTTSVASSISSVLSSGLPLFKRGPISVRPHLVYRFTYSSGIQAGLGNPRDTSIQLIEPGVLFEIGEYWTLDYIPTFTLYSDRAFRDSFDHSVGLSGRKSFGNVSFGVTQGYESRHLLLAETGHQTRQELIATAFDASYRLGTRTYIEANVSRSARYANAVTDAPEWTTSDWLQYTTTEWLRYDVSERLNVAVGVNFGYSEVSAGSDTTFTTPQARISWQPTEKISLSAQGGIENRNFTSGPRNNLRSPVYSANASYQPLDTTKVSLDFNRSVSASYFANDISKSGGWGAGIDQRLLGRLYLSVGVSEQSTDFLPTQEVVGPRRTDRYRSLNTRLSTAFFRGAAVSVLYQTGHNSSDLDAYEFNTEQIGFELSYSF